MEGREYIRLLALCGAILLVPHLVTNDYYLGILVFAAFNCLSCVGLCLLMGYAGQISLGHAAFMGIGAYASGILTTQLGWSPWLALGAGLLISAGIALLIGLPSLRLRGYYLAMATLGFGSIVHIVAVAAVDLTGGPGGLIGIPQLQIGGMALDSDLKYFYFAWAAVVLGLFLALNLIHSRTGRALRAIHGSEAAAAACGVHTAAYKIQIFVLSAMYASLAGSLYAAYVSYIDPGPFDIMHSVLLVTMVAVGGMHRVWGAMVGAVLLSLLPELLSLVSEWLQQYGIAYKADYDTLIYGGILLAIMLFLPGGLLEGMEKTARWAMGSKKKEAG